MEFLPSLEGFESRFDIVHQTRFARTIKYLEIKDNKGHFPNIFGYYTLKLGKDTHFVPFALSVAEQMGGSACGLGELKVIKRIGGSIERRYAEQGGQVIDISLPPSWGFTGNRYGYREVLWLFPHLR